MQTVVIILPSLVLAQERQTIYFNLLIISDISDIVNKRQNSADMILLCVCVLACLYCVAYIVLLILCCLYAIVWASFCVCLKFLQLTPNLSE